MGKGKYYLPLPPHNILRHSRPRRMHYNLLNCESASNKIIQYNLQLIFKESAIKRNANGDKEFIINQIIYLILTEPAMYTPVILICLSQPETRHRDVKCDQMCSNECGCHLLCLLTIKQTQAFIFYPRYATRKLYSTPQPH